MPDNKGAKGIYLPTFMEGKMQLKYYRQLSGEVKALATRYWLAVVLDVLKLENLNQLATLLRGSLDAPEHAKCSVSFLYKKWRGSPIESEAKIKLIDKFVPGASKCLTNPLWRLLDEQPERLKSTAILQELNAHVTAELFESQTTMHPSLPEESPRME
jgi:hypothetical protein